VNRFALFGPAHLGALATTALLAFVLVRLARASSRAGSLAIRIGLTVALAGATAATLARWSQAGRLTVWDVLPLHLCDFLILVGAFALLTLRPVACELLFFWSTGTALAMLGPDLQGGFPAWTFLSFFALHGLVVIAALVTAFGFGMEPRPGAAWRVFALTNAYAVVVGAVNAAFGTNYLFLRAKPHGATLLDWFGPWPVYLFVAEAAALVSFLLLETGLRALRTASARSLARSVPGRVQ
jgi:hypothetical integral membrane protein (TIGR02206 family)